LSDQAISQNSPDGLTVMVLTFNEQDNLQRSLSSLDWARRILVVDSFSTDGTLDIVRQFPQAVVVHRAFDNFAGQCNHGLAMIGTPWTLSIDADYVFPANSRAAIEAAMNEGPEAFTAGFEYWIHGRPVRGSILPPRTVLYRTRLARYQKDGHGHRVRVSGVTGQLPFCIAHDDRKPLARWLEAQVSYARDEAESLDITPRSQLNRNDRIRRWILPAPPLVFCLVYLLRGGFLSGWRGLFYALQRFTAELLLSLFLLDRKLRNRSDKVAD
jgi:glycosyltransferase involved in cell wall biosynthesis